MKRIITMVFALVVANVSQAQNAQQKMLMQHVAELQVQLGLVKKGYQIAKDGLNTVSNWTNGEYGLHKDHFNSLLKVNGSVKDSDKRQASWDVYREILREFNHAIHRAQSSSLFVQEEIKYFNDVYEKVMKDCREILDNISMVSSEGAIKMTDDERLARIDEYYDRMLDNYSFAKSFCTDIRVLAEARKRHKEDVEEVRKLFKSN